MKFEIDMLAVGNADAIVIHYFDDNDEEFIVLIDAGKTREHGKKIEEHIKKYTIKKSIDLAITTHPDGDHIGGFFYLLESDIEISEFWIHDPSSHKIRTDLLETIITKDGEIALENEYYNNQGNLKKILSFVKESLSASNSILSIFALYKGNILSTPTPFEILRTVKVAPGSLPCLRAITRPSNA